MDEGRNENAKRTGARPGCLSTGVTVLLISVGVFWLVTGMIDISAKDIHLKGFVARSLALVWILFWSLPIIAFFRKK